MSTDLVPSKGNFLSTNDDYFAQIANVADGLKGGGDGKAFMKYDGNVGNFSYGAEDVDLPVGTQLVMNPMSARKGWVIWVNSEVVHEQMVDFIEHMPSKAALPKDHEPYGKDDGPVEQFTIDFKMLEEPFVEMVFQANNVSKRRAFAAVMKEFGKTYKLHPRCLPVIELDTNEFEAKGENGRKYKKHAPVFKIVGWISEEELATLAEGAPGDYEQSAEPEQQEEVVQQPAKQVSRAPAKAAPQQAQQAAPPATPGRRARF